MQPACLHLLASFLFSPLFSFSYPGCFFFLSFIFWANKLLLAPGAELHSQSVSFLLVVLSLALSFLSSLSHCTLDCDCHHSCNYYLYSQCTEHTETDTGRERKNLASKLVVVSTSDFLPVACTDHSSHGHN